MQYENDPENFSFKHLMKMKKAKMLVDRVEEVAANILLHTKEKGKMVPIPRIG